MQAVFGVGAPWRCTEAPGSTSQGYKGPEESYAAFIRQMLNLGSMKAKKKCVELALKIQSTSNNNTAVWPTPWFLKCQKSKIDSWTGHQLSARDQASERHPAAQGNVGSKREDEEDNALKL